MVFGRPNDLCGSSIVWLELRFGSNDALHVVSPVSLQFCQSSTFECTKSSYFLCLCHWPKMMLLCKIRHTAHNGYIS